MPKVLLVDDSATDRRLYSGLLEKEPTFTVTSCDNGWTALKRVQSEQPDVVVTDMQMPEMDGLQLVNRVRKNFPQIPVILITSQGSEMLAAKALKQGAAGYVPKSKSSELLRETVSHVCELSQAAANYERLLGCAAVSHFEFVLENDETLIPPLLDLAQRMLGSMGLCDPTACLQVGVALEHAILNAMYHGNLEVAAGSHDTSHDASKPSVLAAQSPHKDRRVHVAMRIGRDEARFVIRDEGPGFDIREVTEVGLSTSLHGTSGRGLFLMWAFMDKVSFDETGNTVTLIKRRAAAEPERQAPTEEEDTKKRLVLPDVLGELVAETDEKTYQLTHTRVTVGREPSCDIVINATSVSHHHCVMYLYEGWWYVKDLESKNGIKVNHKPVSQHLVPPGSTLSVGTVDLEARYEPHELGAFGITPPVDPF